MVNDIIGYYMVCTITIFLHNRQRHTIEPTFLTNECLVESMVERPVASPCAEDDRQWCEYVPPEPNMYRIDCSDKVKFLDTFGPWPFKDTVYLEDSCEQ